MDNTSLTLSKGQETRRNILAAAYSLFLEHGFAATSMREIAARANLSLGAIYNHFDSKEAIFGEVLVVYYPFRQVLPRLESVPGDTLEEFVRNAAAAILEEIRHHPDALKLLFIEIIEFEGRDLPRLFSEMLPLVQPVIARFSSNPPAIKPIPPIVIFRAFMGMFISFYMTEFMFKGTPVMQFQEHAFDQFVDIFVSGILAEKERP